MAIKRTDRDIFDALAKRLGASPRSAEFNERDCLIKLSFYGSALSQPPAELWQLTNLCELDIRCNRLTSLPPEIGELTKLQRLDLSYNQLTYLPTEIKQLAGLQELILGHNQFTSILPEIGQLTGLRKLMLGNKGRGKLPDVIAKKTDSAEHYISRENQLTSLSTEIWQMRKLKKLDLDNNQFENLPADIKQLSNLRHLSIHGNPLRVLPSELGQLINLKTLSIGHRIPERKVGYEAPTDKQLAELQQLIRNKELFGELPLEIWLLTNLQELNLTFSQLAFLPPEIEQLTNLQQLALGYNQLTFLPAEFGQLTNLKVLYLHNNRLTSLPPEIGQLIKLEQLTLGNNQFVTIPSEIRRLINLQRLNLNNLQLSYLPREIWMLPNLQDLELNFNQLVSLPSEIGQLTTLQELELRNNQLASLPPEVGQLTALRKVFLNGNRLRQLPAEMGQLINLLELDIEKNPDLLTPPPELVKQGTNEILTFLRELQDGSIIRYEAKLLVVGEGGTGKSSLLRALRDEAFDPHLSTTHGIEVSKLDLTSSIGKITLNTWDFGGQHIYHATHQFFLTRRSLYIVVWNARLGVEQGRLHYWLETIKALAPEASVLLIATHVDERQPDLNYQLLKATFSQLVGNLSVSNKSGTGLAEIKMEVANQAANLPLIGQSWPQKWLDVEENLMSRPEHHIDATTYVNCCSSHSVDETVAKGTLGAYLHDLGKILYFRDDYVLSNLVVLKPNWITKAISRILTDSFVSKSDGILQHSELPRIWDIDEEGHPYEPYLYPIFLRLMERFDLSYQIESDVPGEHATRSLVPQLLPYQPPINLPLWPKIPLAGQTQVEMVYRFDFVPAGIMSWYIVRTHRYTKNLHWREGVLLAYQGHDARVELNTMSRELRLLVWGVQPHNFFTILMNTVDIILSRFQGLVARREIPCICHWDRSGAEPCKHFYSYEELVRRMEARRYKVECAQTFAEVSVPMLLYGIHSSTDEQVMTDIQSGQQRIEKRLDDLQKLDIILEKLQQQSELIVRNFTRQWNLEMQKMEAECPNTFILGLGSKSHFNPKNWISQEYILQLMCQHPPGPHKVGDGYKLSEAEEWWVKVSPWLNQLIKFIKFGVPMGKAIGAVYEGADVEYMKAQIDLMDEISKQLPEITSLDTLKDAVIDPHLNYEQRVIGPALRAIHSFLSKADPGRIWGGLNKTLTPDGNILWLCEEHRELYEVKPLSLEA